MTTLAYTTRLYLLAKINPMVLEVLGGPRISPASRKVFAAMVLKSAAKNLHNHGISERLNEIGKNIFHEGAEKLKYDDEGGWPCGTNWPWNHPIPHPNWEEIFGFFDPLNINNEPDPSPWKNIREWAALNPQPQPPVEKEKYLGAMIVMLSEIVTNSKYADELKNIGLSLIENRAI